MKKGLLKIIVRDAFRNRSLNPKFRNGWKQIHIIANTYSQFEISERILEIDWDWTKKGLKEIEQDIGTMLREETLKSAKVINRANALKPTNTNLHVQRFSC